MDGAVGLIVLLCILHTGCAITCYSCNNDPNSSGPYDPNCDTDGYDGNVINNSAHQTCYTNMYDDGSLYRGVDLDEHEDGTCSHYGSDTICFCASDKCNNNLCAHCGENPTTIMPSSITSHQTTDAGVTTTTAQPSSSSEQPTDTPPATTIITTTEEPVTTSQTTGVSTDTPPSTTNRFTTIDHTTDSPTTSSRPTTDQHTTTDSQTTTKPITETTATTKPPVTDPSTTHSTADQVLTTTEMATTTTTTPPVISLSCYDCQNTEPAYDNYDEDCGEDNYSGMTYTCNNCFSCTVQVHDDGKIFRGEAGVFDDGECDSGIDVEDGGNYITCYCTSDNCNADLCQHCDP